jgi:DNA-binding transcriptional ArsR family regulator
MATTNQMAEISALLGDPARAAMLGALMDGRALTAGELARASGITAQTASAHLARLTGAGLLAAEKQGRHRYHRLASPEVARMIEGIMRVATALRPVATGPRDAGLRAGRTCYDHLAGRLGVALADALVEGGQIELAHDGGLVTEKGVALLQRLGIAPGTARRPVCRPCLDWSERRPHIAGQLGAPLCAHCFGQGWVRRVEGTRAVTVTPHGGRMLREVFGVKAS